MAICLDLGGGEGQLWVSRLDEAGGSRQSGEAFEITWNPERNRDNYVIVLLKIGSMMPPRNISVSTTS